jgi:hypothetical protein
MPFANGGSSTAGESPSGPSGAIVSPFMRIRKLRVVSFNPTRELFYLPVGKH